MSISAVVIALNEERNLPTCLDSLRFAQEIIVVDGGSSDRTIEVARRYTEKVFQRTFDNFSAQKNFGISKASGDWILSIDADERVSDTLAQEIRRVTTSTPMLGFQVPRKTRLFRRLFQYSGLQSDRPLRFFKKDAGQFEGNVHERVRVDGKVGRLKEFIGHESFQTFREYMRRLELYTSFESSVRCPKQADFILRPIHRFTSLYFWNQGFRDGVEGFFYCTLSAFYEFLKQAKLWEKNRANA